jgi:hypothetical protein
MRTLIAICMALAAVAAIAEEPKTAVPAKGTEIYQTDKYGRIRHDQPSWVVKENGRIVEVSPYGHEQSQKQQYKIEGDRVYHADFAGRIQYSKPSYTVGKDGRVIQTDPYGHPQYNAPQYKVDGSKVYEADQFGHVKQQAYEIKPKPSIGSQR